MCNLEINTLKLSLNYANLCRIVVSGDNEM